MARRPRWFLACALLLATPLAAHGCSEDSASFALIGPEGGEVSGEGVVLKFPAGALATTRQIVIRPVEADLSRGTYKQSGGAFRLEPTDLDLRIPAELTFSGDAPAKPAVLWRRGEGRVVAYAAADDRPLAFIGGLGVVALAEAGDPPAKVDEPALVRSPGEVDYGKAAVNLASVKVTPAGGQTSLQLGFTAYDPMGMSNRPLNGDGSRYCGFKFGSVQGGSITGGCSGGAATGSLTVSSTQVQIEALPFLLGKVDNPMLVEVQVGGDDLGHSVGFFGFTTSACYLESCSGHGVCDDTSGAPACMCEDGYAPGEELSCLCVPNCEGRECGGDGCGGDCGDCGGAQCNDQGQCEGEMPMPMTSTGPEPDPSSTSDDGTTTTGDGTTTTGDGTTTTGDGSSSTSDGSSSGSTG